MTPATVTVTATSALTLPLRSTFAHRSLPRFPSATSTALFWPSTSPSPRLRLFFIPGNPGFAEYYIPFLTRLHNLVGHSHLEILAVSHVGHAGGRPILSSPMRGDVGRGETEGRRASWWEAVRGRLPGLEEQERAKLEVLERWCDESRDGGADGQEGDERKAGKVLLMGHSVGSWLSLRLLLARPDLITRSYLLFPTLSHITHTPNGRRLSFLWRPSTRFLLLLLQGALTFLLPFTLLQSLLRLHFRYTRPEPSFRSSPTTTGEETEMVSAIDTTATLVKYGATAAATIEMGSDEMRIIAELGELEEAFKLPALRNSKRSRLVAYFAKGEKDGWVPSTHVQSVVDAFERNRHVHVVQGKESDAEKEYHICEQGMPHAFCLEHSAPMADIASKWLERELKDD